MVQSQQFALQILTEASCKDSMDLGFRDGAPGTYDQDRVDSPS